MMRPKPLNLSGMCCHPTKVGSARAFTLIEVLMATFILALGVLGMTALFAGAARQQQIASKTTTSVTVGKSAEAIIARYFGALEEQGADPDAPPPLKEGVWYELSANPNYHYLTVDPTGNGGFYFRKPHIEPLPAAIFERPSSELRIADLGFSAGNPDGPYAGRMGTFQQRRILADSLVVRVTTVGFDRDPTIPGVRTRMVERSFEYRPVDNTNPNRVRLVRDGDPANLNTDYIIVDTQSVPVNGSDPATVFGMQIEDLRGSQLYYASDNPNVGDLVYEQVVASSGFSTQLLELVPVPAGTGNVRRFNDQRASDGGRYVEQGIPGQYRLQPGSVPGETASGTTYVNVGISGGGGDYIVQPFTPPGTPGGIMVRAARTPWRMVERIEVLNYEWRSDEIVSLNDRIVERTDATNPNGFVPDLAYSLLYRQKSDGAVSQIAVVTYDLRGDRPTAEYIPPERPIDYRPPSGNFESPSDSPLTRIKMRLAYDNDVGSYTVQVPDKLKWAVAPGQLLLFAGERQNNSTIVGSDVETRVLRRVKGANDTWIGYLDRAPRADGDATLYLPNRNPGTSEEHVVWVLQDVVESLADESKWRLAPLEMRIFQVRSR